MPAPQLSTGWTLGLLVALLLLVGLLLAGLGSAVLLPQGVPALVLGGALLLFVGLQAVLFRGLGLRSKADESLPADDSDDWRAWKG